MTSSRPGPCEACIPRSRARRASGPSGGFTYMALLVAIIIIGISMSAAGKYWQYAANREREEELLFRGDQYRQAIERYVNAIPGRNQFPQNIDDLLQDSRTAAGRRHLRQRYQDPITGGNFEEIRDPARGNRIVGVHSRSDKEPLKKHDFPEPYRSFENKMQYSEWKFIVRPPQGQDAPPQAPAPAAKKVFNIP